MKKRLALILHVLLCLIVCSLMLIVPHAKKDSDFLSLIPYCLHNFRKLPLPSR